MVLTIAIAAMIFTAGVGAGAVFLKTSGSDNSADNSEVDQVRKDLNVGDNSVFKADMRMFQIETKSLNSTSDIYNTLNIMYQKYGTQTGEQTITYRGVQKLCDVYENVSENQNSTYFVDKTSKVVYKFSISCGDDITVKTLKDTNLSVDKTREYQTVETGSYLKYDYSEDTPLGRYVGDYIIDIQYSAYQYSSTISGTMTQTTNATLSNDSSVWEITKITSDGKYYLKDRSEPLTKFESINYLSYYAFIDNLEEHGYTVTKGWMAADKIDTVNGERDVSTEKITAVKNSDRDVYYVTYGAKGVIYGIEIHQAASTKTVTGTVSLVSSTLISKT